MDSPKLSPLAFIASGQVVGLGDSWQVAIILTRLICDF